MSRTNWLLAPAALLALLALWWNARRPSEAPSAPIAVDVAVPAASGDPYSLFSELASAPVWKTLADGKKTFTTSYTQVPWGPVALRGARFSEAKDSSYRVHADDFALGETTWHSVDFALQRRGDMLELRPRANAEGIKPLEIDYAKGRGGVLWALRLPHQPARAALQYYEVPFAPESDATRMLATISIVVADDATIPVSGRLETVFDAWGKPDWPDAQALFGDTLSFGARALPTANARHWELEHARITTLVFSLEGSGRAELGPNPTFSLEAKGERTCKQLRENLGPSLYLDEVTRYLTSPNAAADSKVELSLRVSLDPKQGRREAKWQLGSGCGLTPR